MDIQKDLIQQLKGRAEFCRHRGEIKTPELLERAAELLEAKAQAVPEGFVLVPKEPTDKTIAHMINTPIEVNLLCDHADVFLSEGEACIAYQAMIAAQEPK